MSTLIGITTSFRENGPKPVSSRIRPSRPEVFLSQALISRVRNAGGEPVLLPPGGGCSVMKWAMESLDAIIVSGGSFDIHPSLYGQEVSARLDSVQNDRSIFEIDLIRLCVRTNKPLLGICGGMQALAVATGGTLIQDIASQRPDALEHEQPTDPSKGWHTVSFDDRWFQQIYGNSTAFVNSTHHQAVLDSGLCMVSGTTSDGIIEAIRHPELDFCVGVQWHPELLSNTLFQALIDHVETR